MKVHLSTLFQFQQSGLTVDPLDLVYFFLKMNTLFNGISRTILHSFVISRYSSYRYPNLSGICYENKKKTRART